MLYEQTLTVRRSLTLWKSVFWSRKKNRRLQKWKFVKLIICCCMLICGIMQNNLFIFAVLSVFFIPKNIWNSLNKIFFEYTVSSLLTNYSYWKNIQIIKKCSYYTRVIGLMTLINSRHLTIMINNDHQINWAMNWTCHSISISTSSK